MSYSVRLLGGCKVIEGCVPLYELAALLLTWAQQAGEPATLDEEWVVDPELSAALEVMLVCGTRSAVKELRARVGFAGE